MLTPACCSYSPQLFITLGTGQSAALAATIVTGVVNHVATYVSLWAADEFGRRLLFLEAGVQVRLSLPITGAPAQREAQCRCSCRCTRMYALEAWDAEIAAKQQDWRDA